VAFWLAASSPRGSYRATAIVGDHASERLEERGIMERQVVVGLEDSELIAGNTKWLGAFFRKYSEFN
jgi:hypothetical protein